MAWASNGWSRVRWSWEPVLFVTNRKGLKPGEASTVWDGIVAAPVVNGGGEVAGKGLGAKPQAFVRWMLELFDYEDGDELTDVFTGSGNVERYAATEQLEAFA